MHPGHRAGRSVGHAVGRLLAPALGVFLAPQAPALEMLPGPEADHPRRAQIEAEQPTGRGGRSGNVAKCFCRLRAQKAGSRRTCTRSDLPRAPRQRHVAAMRSAPLRRDEVEDGAPVKGLGCGDRGRGPPVRLAAAESSEGRPRKGASRTPALELPIMQAAFFINSEKCAKRIEGRSRKRSLGRALMTRKMASEPGSLLGAISTKFRPLSTQRAEQRLGLRPDGVGLGGDRMEDADADESKSMPYARLASAMLTPEGCEWKSSSASR